MHSTIVHHSGSQRQFSARTVVAMKIIWNKFVSTRQRGKKIFVAHPNQSTAPNFCCRPLSVEKSTWGSYQASKTAFWRYLPSAICMLNNSPLGMCRVIGTETNLPANKWYVLARAIWIKTPRWKFAFSIKVILHQFEPSNFISTLKSVL